MQYLPLLLLKVYLACKMVGLSLFTAIGGLCGLVVAQSSYNNTATYTNPVLNGVGADPWVVRDGGYYYLTYTTNTNITILRSKTLTDWNDADVKLAFDPPVSGDDASQQAMLTV